ncbi:Hypothetical protein ACI5QM_00469 [Bacillus subtilis]
MLIYLAGEHCLALFPFLPIIAMILFFSIQKKDGLFKPILIFVDR